MATQQKTSRNMPPKGSIIHHLIGGRSALDDEATRERLNQFSSELQYDAEDHRQDFVMDTTVFVSGSRLDIPRFGMLSDVFRRTPVVVYDLPELKMRVNTAFVDKSGRLYISDTFYKGLVSESARGKGDNWRSYGLFFLFLHECEHLRRLHLDRMRDVPPRVANIAQDIRINIDITTLLVSDILLSNGVKTTDFDYELTFEEERRRFLDNLCDTLKSGCAVTYDEQKKWGKMSEEEIAIKWMQENKDDDKDDGVPEDHEISIKDLTEAVAQDMDATSAIANKNKDHASSVECKNLSTDIRDAGSKKLKVPKASLVAIKTSLCDLVLNSPHMIARNVEHDSLQISGKSSVTVKDVFIAGLRPNDRAGLLVKIIDMVLNPQNGNDPSEKGGLSIKDLDMAGQGAGEGGGKSSGSDAGGDHTMTSEELAKILKDAGLHNTVKALGYDNHINMGSNEEASKEAVIGAINTAADQLLRAGSVYPGGHIVNYSKEQMHSFYEPTISLKSIMKNILCAPGRASGHDPMTPWGGYFADPRDFGFGSNGDMPFLGSIVPRQNKKSVIAIIIDTSGSVNDNMLKRFISEAVNMARDTETKSSPEVIVTFADTVIRGEPLFIDHTNYEGYLKKGVSFGGRGGTDFNAATEHVLRMTEPNGALERRKFDAIIYFTDTFDAPPDGAHLNKVASECRMKELPPMLFLAPVECTNKGFKDAVESQGYGQVVFFNTKELLEIDIGALGDEIGSKNDSVTRVGRKARP